MRRLDPSAGKITLRHGEIAELDMPPMTMVFQVRDPSMLQGLQVGMKVRFRAQKHQGAYVVTEIKPAP
nr:copper-binding protein [uncultured Tepidimonas sp.]